MTMGSRWKIRRVTRSYLKIEGMQEILSSQLTLRGATSRLLMKGEVIKGLGRIRWNPLELPPVIPCPGTTLHLLATPVRQPRGPQTSRYINCRTALP